MWGFPVCRRCPLCRSCLASPAMATASNNNNKKKTDASALGFILAAVQCVLLPHLARPVMWRIRVSPEPASPLGAGNGTGIAWMSVMTSWMLPVPRTTSAAVMVVRHARREKAGWWNRDSGLWNTSDHPVVLHRTCSVFFASHLHAQNRMGQPKRRAGEAGQRCRRHRQYSRMHGHRSPKRLKGERFGGEGHDT